MGGFQANKIVYDLKMSHQYIEIYVFIKIIATLKYEMFEIKEIQPKLRMRIHQINKFCNQIQLIEIGLECVVERIEEEKTIKIQQCEIGLNVGRKESEKSKNTTM